MALDPNTDLILDDYMLLKLIRSIEEEQKNWYIDQVQQYKCFSVIFENEMLRKTMIPLLEANINVSIHKNIMNKKRFKYLQKKFFIKLYNHDLERLIELEQIRDKFWDNYELIRRLICFQNKSLIVYKS